MRRLIARFRPQVVHAHKLYPQLSAAPVVVAHRAGIPVVQHLHDYEFISASWRDHSGGWMDRDESRRSIRALNDATFVVRRALHARAVDAWIANSRYVAGRHATRGHRGDGPAVLRRARRRRPAAVRGPQRGAIRREARRRQGGSGRPAPRRAPRPSMDVTARRPGPAGGRGGRGGAAARQPDVRGQPRPSRGDRAAEARPGLPDAVALAGARRNRRARGDVGGHPGDRLRERRARRVRGRGGWRAGGRAGRGALARECEALDGDGAAWEELSARGAAGVAADNSPEAYAAARRADLRPLVG